MEKIILIGGGGHARSIIDTIISSGVFTIAGIVDNFEGEVLGIPVIGDDRKLTEIFNSGIRNAFVAIGSVGDTTLRKNTLDMILKIGFTVPNIVDKTAVVSVNTAIGFGNFIGKNAVVNCDCTIGNMVIINSNATVEHNSYVGDFSHIASGAVLCGTVTIGKNTHIGANATVIQGVTIGEDCLIGAGSVVLGNINDRVKAYGNPCRVAGDKV